jgi:predicted DNA-binding protein (UPF0251 family)
MEKMKIKVAENLSVEVRPNETHEFLMSTKEVAHGYGVSKYAIFKTLGRHTAELIEGKHFIKGVDILSTPPTKGVTILNDPCISVDYNEKNTTYWTKRGIVRLGFFIRSERARMFRDWAEDLIIATMEFAEKKNANISNPPREYCKRAAVAGDVRTLEMLWLIDEALYGVNRGELALELGVSRQTIHGVLTGRMRSAKVLSVLYKKALENRKKLSFNPYINIDKAIHELTK